MSDKKEFIDDFITVGELRKMLESFGNCYSIDDRLFLEVTFEIGRKICDKYNL